MRPLTKFSLDDLTYFLAVARTGHLSAAARRLRSNHVTVSRRIDRLEKALSARLFERSPHGYALTVVGERLVAQAETIEREADRFADTVSGGPATLRGAVRLSTPEGFANFFLAGRLPRLAERIPSLTIEFVTIQQIVSPSRRQADLIVALDRPPSGPYRSERLLPYRLFLYGARSYLERARPIRDRASIGGHPLVGYIEDMIFAPGLDYLDEVLPGLRATYQSSSIQAQLTATVAGYGLSILPFYMASAYPELVPVLPREVHIERNYWMICAQDLVDAPRVRAVADFVRDETLANAARFAGDALLA